MSVKIAFRNLVKKYGNNTVIPDLSLQIREGEFFTLLGPSGCGKTTLLRMIAGFNSIEGGTISFNDKVINDLAPGKRNIGMVFQNYAVFPHMTVAKNVAFGLTNRKTPKEEIGPRVDEVLKAVKIDNLRDRLPQNMSGGQQQRIALARAIVIEPDVLLMDEPLSNLDAKLRIEMRSVIKELQHKVGITTVYVTHDQEEAMAVSDRIAVMKDGVIQQCSTPRNIYHRPANLFVATFIGTSNILPGEVLRENGTDTMTLAGARIPLHNLREDLPQGKTPVRVSIRPEDFVVCQGDEGVVGTVRSITFLGTSTHYDIDLADGSRIIIVQESQEEDAFQEGDHIRLTVKSDKINVYNEAGSQNYTKGVVNDVE